MKMQEKIYPIHTYSHLEEQLNIWSHFVGIVFSVVAILLLLNRAFHLDNVMTYVSFPVYGASMLMLYLASTLYHASRKPRLRYRLNIFDHISIFIFIAGSYTPFALVTLNGTAGWMIFAVVWTIALLGSALKIFFTGRFNILSTMLYVAMGWMIVFSFRSLFRNMETEGIVLLVAGGIAYTVGAVFYSISRLKLNHSIFHFFVLAGSVLHFLSVYLYVYPLK